MRRLFRARWVGPAMAAVLTSTVLGGTPSAAALSAAASYSTQASVARAPRVTALTPRAGSLRGGTVVTITGTGLSRVTRVMFGTVRGTRLTVRSSTRLTVVAPAHPAGAVYIRVVRAGVRSARISAALFTFGRPPTVSIVGPRAGPARGGVVVEVRGSGFTRTSRITFGGVPGKRLLVHSSSRLTVVAPPHGAGPVDVRVTNAFGSSARSSVATFRYTLPVVVGPPATAPPPLPPPLTVTPVPPAPTPPIAPPPVVPPPVVLPSSVSVENALPGTGAWAPLYTTSINGALEGYASDESVAPGESLQFHVSAAAADAYRINIFRLGYYQGTGGRLVGCLPSCTTTAIGVRQTIVAPDPTTGLAAQNWPVTDSMAVPADWVSGYYVAKLTLKSGANSGKSAPVPFIVRQAPGAPASRMLVVSSSNTEQAYNQWGGKSLYAHNSTGNVPATQVSFDRPYGNQVLFFELPFVQFIESQIGLDPSYIADVDVDRAPAELVRHRFTLVNGHSEYWSKGIRDGYEAARAAGVNLAFWGGDQGDWQVRYADNLRTMVGYKLAADPYPDPAQRTSHFSTLVPPRPQCQLLGTSFLGGFGTIATYAVNNAALGDRYFAGTGFAAGGTFPGNGFEYDFVAGSGCLPYPTTVFFADSTRPTIGPALRYTTPSGSTVVTIASEALAMISPPADPRLQRFALNVLTDLSQ